MKCRRPKHEETMAVSSACKSSLTRDKTHLPIAAPPNSKQQTGGLVLYYQSHVTAGRLSHAFDCMSLASNSLLVLCTPYASSPSRILIMDLPPPLHPLSLPALPPLLTNHHPLHCSFCSACRTTTPLPFRVTPTRGGESQEEREIWEISEIGHRV